MQFPFFNKKMLPLRGKNNKSLKLRYMKKIFFVLLIAAVSMGAKAQLKVNKYHEPIKVEKKWLNYDPGEVIFHDEAPQTEGSKIYHNIIPNPTPYIQENARRVLQTLYYGPKDKNIPKLKTINYYLVNEDGISWKGGGGDNVGVWYTTGWIEKSFQNNDTMRLDYETRGVLYHELTHAYQLNPQGCGNYEDGGENWCFIEGTADAVRLACGCFEQDFKSKDRPRAESWRKGYRVAGYFLYWLQLNKDKNFIRKFNASASELNPWSWDKAMKHILGDKPENGVEELWNEYLHAIGDK